MIAGIPLECRLAAKRSHINEDRRGDKRSEINRHDGRHFGGAGRNIDHLPGFQHDSQLGICREIDEDLAGEADYLDPALDSRNEKVRSGDRGGDGPSLNLSSAGAFRRGE